MRRLNALYLLARESYGMIFGQQERQEIASLVEVIGPPLTRENYASAADQLAQADILFSGWGAPTMDDAFLNLCPRLKAVFYASGAAPHVATPMARERGIIVTTAYAANAVPVAEYSFATIVFSLKHGWQLSKQMHSQRRFVPRDGAPGCFGRTVGLVSLGMIGRTLLKLLKSLDVHILAYDPFLSAEEADVLGVERVSLDELFRRSNVVSLHTPSLAETHGMITGCLLASMPNGATFINTSRGEVVKEAEMIEVLTHRPDLQAVLDVIEREPADPTSKIFDLPNVVLTPHIAGSVGQECRRMGQFMIAELKRYLAGEPLQWVVTPELAARSTHRSWVTRPKPVASAVTVTVNPDVLTNNTSSQRLHV